jgi:hypothetical protein
MTIYIMRINWYNYNSAWEDGYAFTDRSECVTQAISLLTDNYKASVKDLGLEDAQMVLVQHTQGIDVVARQVGKNDKVLGTAEIYTIPLVDKE